MGHVLEAMLDRYLGDLTSQINAIARDGRLSAQAADAVEAVLTRPVKAAAGDTQVTLTWAASAGATSYNAKRSASKSGPWTTIGTTADLSFTATGRASMRWRAFQISPIPPRSSFCTSS